MIYIVEPAPGTPAEGGRWLVRVRSQVIATFRTKEAACKSARTLARLDLLAGREAEAWLFGCRTGP